MHPTKLMTAGVVLLLAGVPRLADAGAAAKCEPAGQRTVVVALTPPAGVGLAGLKVRLDYPEQQVALRGRVDDADVKARVTGMPAGVLGQPNDEDDALIVAMVSTSPIAAGPIFTVAFDACRGAGAAGAASFRCTIEQASDEQGQLVSGASCRVTLRNETEGVES